MKTKGSAFWLLFAMTMEIWCVLIAICDRNEKLSVLIVICDENEKSSVLMTICDENEDVFAMKMKTCAVLTAICDENDAVCVLITICKENESFFAFWLLFAMKRKFFAFWLLFAMKNHPSRKKKEFHHFDCAKKIFWHCVPFKKATLWTLDFALFCA